MASGIHFLGFGMAPDKSDIVRLLMGKESGCTKHDEGFKFIGEIQLYNHEPVELSNLAPYSGNEKKYFFTRLEKKYPDKKVIKRQTPSGGFWRKTGWSIDIEDKGRPIAKETSFAYYQPSNEKTQWLMKEYMLLKSEWALCVVYSKPPSKTIKRKRDAKDND